MAIADKEARDQRLDDLATATTEWATKKRKRLQDQAAFAKALLKGRTGAERLNNSVVTSATDLLVDEINDFLTGL
jgi:hypothetical protein